MQSAIADILRLYNWPSQAYWRYFEVQALREVVCERPILEIGCGDGRFSSFVFDKIDEAIDVNPRSVGRCQQLSSSLYGRVRCLDARDLELSDSGFATVYANCVLEHIPQIDQVLSGCFRGLRPGGKLVVTVPLVRMNEHLALPWCWYAKLRQKQLCHINLLSEAEWEAILQNAGFSDVEFRPYLSACACRFWDLLDSPGCIGVGRYHVAAAVARIARRSLPSSTKRWLIDRISRWLSNKTSANTPNEPACAALVLARKPAIVGLQH